MTSLFTVPVLTVPVSIVPVFVATLQRFLIVASFASHDLAILAASRADVSFTLLAFAHTDMARRFVADCAHEI